MNSLEKSILATIAYYDVLEKPLTGWEVFKFMINLRHINSENTKQISLNKTLDALENSDNMNLYIGQKNGFYFLKNKQNLIKKRINKQKIADNKWKIARKYIKFLELVPFIRFIGVSGSLAINNTKENSDIDLLIISKQNRIWTCRTITTLITQVLGKRRHSDFTKDRLCLNHYLTEKSLKIKYQSLYNAQTYAHLTPIWQEDKIYSKFQRQNKWIKNYLVFYPQLKQDYSLAIKHCLTFGILRKFQELILKGKTGELTENFLKKVQTKRIKNDPLTYAKDGRVIFNDSQLEFHPNSPEKKILEQYNRRVAKINLKEFAKEKDSGLFKEI